MKLLILVIYFYTFVSYAQGISNPVGGEFSSQAMSAVARVDDATSPVINPAGLRHFTHNSISSGSSAYSFNFQKESEKNEPETNSSTSHVAYIHSLSNFNIGFMIYTGSDSFTETNNYNRYNNSEGYDSYYDSTSKSKTSINSYMLAIAPKHSNWGLSFNLTDYDSKYFSNTNAHKYYLTDIYSRETSHNSSETMLNFKLLELSFGQQFNKGQFQFGYHLRGPSYVIANNSKYKINYISVLPAGANDVTLFTLNHESKYNIEDKKFSEGSLALGAAYLKEKYEVELDIAITPASKTLYMQTSETPKSALWQSGTDTYQQTQTPDATDYSSEYSRANITPLLGFSYKNSTNEKIGLGMSYSKTTDKNDLGTNSLTITTGYTNQYKNFKGSYAIVYNQEFDTGQNTQYNREKDIDEKYDMSSTQIGFVFGGSYTF